MLDAHKIEEEKLKKWLKTKKNKMILTKGVQGKNMHAVQKSFIKSTMWFVSIVYRVFSNFQHSPSLCEW